MPTGGAKQTTLLQFKSPTDNGRNPDHEADDSTGRLPTGNDEATASGQQQKRPRTELEDQNQDADIERLLVPQINDATGSETSLFSSTSHETIIETDRRERRFLPSRNDDIDENSPIRKTPG